MPYKNIVLAYDDSKYSKAALIETLHWAEAHDSKVTVVHAVFYDSDEFTTSPNRFEQQVRAGRDACEKVMDECSGEFDVDINYLIRQGEPHEVIRNIADELGADLIAMGTHGRKGLRKLVMGSVTASVIPDAPCDVLVVNKPCEDCTGEYKNILIPYDNSSLSRKAVHRIAGVINSNGASVTIFYVIPRYQEMIGFFNSDSVRKQVMKEAEKVVVEGEQIANDDGINVNTVIEEGHAADKINAAVRELGSDLVVLGSHGWRGFDKGILGSTAERVITYSSVPVLIVR